MKLIMELDLADTTKPDELAYALRAAANQFANYYGERHKVRPFVGETCTVDTRLVAAAATAPATLTRVE
jgi:hypothetical protein